jgi:hypothetical protein
MKGHRLRCALWTAAVAVACGCGETASEDPSWPEFALLQEADYEHTYPPPR